MGIHEFICNAKKGDANCLLTFDLSKVLDKQKKEMEREFLKKKALQSGVELCYLA